MPSVGENGTAIGHGQTVSGGPTSNTLQKTKISVITNAECGAYFNQTIDSWGVCAFTPGQSLCLGDSGGPMLTPSGILFGVNSFVLYPNECDQGPSGFVRVSSYTDMLASVRFVVVVGPIRCNRQSPPLLLVSGDSMKFVVLVQRAIANCLLSVLQYHSWMVPCRRGNVSIVFFRL